MEQCNRVGRVFLVENNTGKGRRCGPAWREETESSDFLDELPWWLRGGQHCSPTDLTQGIQEPADTE